MELYQLKDFVAVADTGRFHEAAKKNHVASSSLSKAIQKLEVELGEKLFFRSRTRSVLTPAGEVFYRRANRIVRDMVTIKRDLSEKQAVWRKTVNIGVLPSIAPYFLTPAICQLSDRHPAWELTIHECLRGELLQMVENYEIDFAVVSLPVNSESVEKQILFTEELLLAVAPKHPLANKHKIFPDDLEKERLILMRDGCAFE
ncbi:MAG: LysR family transcriptional regulator [Verrucomicrobiota bacterium]|nr:LysR family transcriptional regulator [Verrucomicrobiota bacterium]